MSIESAYQYETLPPDETPPGVKMATVYKVMGEGVTVIADGETRPCTKPLPVNRDTVFAEGDRVLLVRVGAGYVVACAIKKRKSYD